MKGYVMHLHIYLLIVTFILIQDEEVVPLPNVNAAILKKVIQWATYHKDDPPIPEDDENKEKRTDDICSWDADFLKVGTKQKFQMYITDYCGVWY